MKPRPPHLVEAASEWSAGEVKWIVEHGLKYTGMPSFGTDHDDATLWNIAAFVKRLPGMTPAQYHAFGPAHEHGAAAPGSGRGPAAATPRADAHAPTPRSGNGHAHAADDDHGGSH